jgi:hypothetical protein
MVYYAVSRWGSLSFSRFSALEFLKREGGLVAGLTLWGRVL